MGYLFVIVLVWLAVMMLALKTVIEFTNWISEKIKTKFSEPKNEEVSTEQEPL